MRRKRTMSSRQFLRICMAFCFHRFGKINKEVVVKGFGDTHQHVCVNIWPRENLIYIAAIAVEARGKPRGRAAFGLTVKNILYKFAYMHRSLVDLSGRFLNRTTNGAGSFLSLQLRHRQTPYQKQTVHSHAFTDISIPLSGSGYTTSMSVL